MKWVKNRGTSYLIQAFIIRDKETTDYHAYYEAEYLGKHRTAKAAKEAVHKRVEVSTLPLPPGTLI